MGIEQSGCNEASFIEFMVMLNLKIVGLVKCCVTARYSKRFNWLYWGLFSLQWVLRVSVYGLVKFAAAQVPTHTTGHMLSISGA